ncbi:uncharacterized protein [Apostichopus japonicus]
MANRISASDMKSFRKDALATHNKYRDLHGVPSLKMNDKLNDTAQKWADYLVNSRSFTHSEAKDYGENLCSHYSSASTEYSGEEVTDYWYSEIEKYDFRAKAFKKGTGHFTQVVWKDSKEFGIGKAITRDGKVIIVGQYKPAGNLMGAFQENVFPPGTQPQQHKPSQPAEEGDRRRGHFSNTSSDDDRRGKVWKLEVSSSEQSEFQKEALQIHNQYRAHHHVLPLMTSKELNKQAEKWAKHLAENDLFEHSTSDDIGENVAMHYSSLTTAYSGKDASDHWYSELSKYDFEKPGFQKGAGHFTQMVWKDSREFGIAKAITKEGKVIIVGQYRPPGNVINHFDKNVFKRDDGYVPPPPQRGDTKVTRIVRSDEPDTRTVSQQELDDTIRRVGQTKLDKADTSPKDLKSFQKDAVKAQNEYRKNHGVDKLKESPDLMERAQKFAAYLAEKDLFQNSSESDVGENIAMHYSSASTEFSGQACADMWYKQAEKYDFKNPGFAKGAGHFTQMVWKDSKEFGVGKAITKSGKVILVGFYKPPGNVMRKFEDNVLPLKK